MNDPIPIGEIDAMVSEYRAHRKPRTEKPKRVRKPLTNASKWYQMDYQHKRRERNKSL